MASSPVSEMNKPEAERCIEIALAAQAAGDLAKAERFLNKSISMFPTVKAQQLLVTIRSSSSTTSAASDASSFTYQSTSTSTTYQRTERTTAAPVAAPAPAFTAEQQQAARAVISQKNYYLVLQLPLPSSASPPSESDIKAAYRKMALKFHPDKNRAPEAEEAFKRVSAAFQCLSDSRKKAAYDASGYEDGSSSGRGMGGGGAGGGAGREFYTREEDISPEDIFNMFFNGAFTPNGRRVFTMRTGQRQRPMQGGGAGGGGGQAAGGGGTNLMQFMHFLPLILLFIFSFLAAPSSDDSSSLPFSLSPTSSFTTHRITSGSSLPYYTAPSFAYRYARDRRTLLQVEDLVEQAWLKRWREECVKEKAELARLQADMKRRKNKEQVEAMERMEEFRDNRMTNCDRLAKGLRG